MSAIPLRAMLRRAGSRYALIRDATLRAPASVMMRRRGVPDEMPRKTFAAYGARLRCAMAAL